MQQTHNPYEGLFITIEGGEGSGKSTLCSKVSESLSSKGYTVVCTREPGGSALSETIRELLLNPPEGVKIGEVSELLLFLTARAQHIEELIMPALRAGKVVICDRFNDSSIAYQGVARHLGEHYVQQLCGLASGGLTPDCTLFLDLDPEVGLGRIPGKLDRLEKEKLQFHKDVRQAYLHLVDKYSERFEIIDGAKSPDEVLSDALKLLEPHLMLKPA